MTAEEKLEKIQQEEREARECRFDMDASIFVTSNGRVHISSWDIDLIANLVVERLLDTTLGKER